VVQLECMCTRYCYISVGTTAVRVTPVMHIVSELCARLLAHGGPEIFASVRCLMIDMTRLMIINSYFYF
jgi:hypothetical protein